MGPTAGSSASPPTVPRGTTVIWNFADAVDHNITPVEDAFERADDRWHFVERQFFVDLVGDLGEHLAHPIP